MWVGDAGNRLPILPTASRVWTSFGKALRGMPRLFLCAVVAGILLALVQTIVTAAMVVTFPDGVLPNHFQPRLWINGALGALLRSLVAAPIAVAMHRYILLGEVTHDARSLWRARTAHFFLWLFGLQLAYTTISWLQTVLMTNFNGFLYYRPYPGSVVLYVSELLLPVVLGWIVAAYLALVFPALAIDAPSSGAASRLLQSARQMRGNFWRFVAVAVLTIVPVAVVFRIAGPILARHVVSDIIPMGIGGQIKFLEMAEFRSAWYYAHTVSNSVELVLSTAIAAAVASWVYAVMTRRAGQEMR